MTEEKDIEKIKCMMLVENKDTISFGSSTPLTSAKIPQSILTFLLNENSFKRCKIFRYSKDFILHYYITDTIDIDISVGVERYDNCNIIEFNESKKLLKIKASNKQFFNMSQLKMLRKDKIGNMLLEFDEDN